MTKKKGTTVKTKTTKAKPAKKTTQAKKTTPEPDERLSSFREAFAVMYGVRPKLIQLVVHDCRDCPHLHDYGTVSNKGMQQRRYGCQPLVILKRAGEGIEYPFIEVSGTNAQDPAMWKPHPMCPLGLGHG